MVYCPNCHSDHPKELLVCPDCNQELVDRTKVTQPVAEVPDESWVAIANLKGRRLAERAKSSLDSSNIPSMIVPQSFARPFNAPSETEGAFEISGTDSDKLIMVPQEYKEEAAILIKSFLKKELI